MRPTAETAADSTAAGPVPVLYRYRKKDTGAFHRGEPGHTDTHGTSHDGGHRHSRGSGVTPRRTSHQPSRPILQIRTRGITRDLERDPATSAGVTVRQLALSRRRPGGSRDRTPRPTATQNRDRPRRTQPCRLPLALPQSAFPAPVLESGRRAKLKGRSRIPELICFFLFDARPRYRLSGPL